MKRIFLYGAVLILLVALGLWMFSPTAQNRSEQKLAGAKAPSSSPFGSWLSGDDNSPASVAKKLAAPDVYSPAVAPASSTVRTATAKPTAPAKMNADAILLTSSSSGKRPNFLGGEEATANISVAGKNYSLQPNQLGEFPQIDVAAKAKIEVRVSYPQADPQDTIEMEAEDGGALANGKITQAGQLDGSGSVDFQFLVGNQEGIYRITLRQGSDEKQIAFWVGPELSSAR